MVTSAGLSVLAIDQGTTNTKAILVDATGQVQARASTALSVNYPRPSWVEQDAAAIWQSGLRCASEVLGTAQELPVALGISNQRESVVLWERATGEPLAPCVIWQCQRGNALVQTLKQPGVAEDVHRRTGLELESKLQVGLIGSPNQVEAVKANFENRAPAFQDPAA